MTFSLVLDETLAFGVNVRDTADRETPASSATLWDVTLTLFFFLFIAI
jgi:hypothetical protein